MASDITEDFQLDISSAVAQQNSFSNSGIVHDVSFNGEAFFDASSPDLPYRRQTAQYKKDQTDDQSDPGEQTLTGWWLRSQSTFHLGAGSKFFEPAQDPNLRYRFFDSQGIDVWTTGQASLLKDVTAVSTPTISVNEKALIRNISHGLLVNTSTTKLHKINSSGTAIEFVSAASTILDFCDDGTYAYWIINVSSKWAIYRKPLSGSTADTTDVVKLYEHPTAAASHVVMRYVKGRLIIGLGNIIYEAAVSSGSTSTSPVILFTQSNTAYIFSAITESGSNIYLSGYQGASSQIHMLTVANDGTITVLDGAVVVAEMPLGETIEAIQTYLGYMLIGTNFGVRVAQVGSGGEVIYGPLLFRSEQTVYQFAMFDRYAYCTASIGSDTGLIRIDLGQQFDSLRFSYANDLQAVGVQKDCLGVATVGSTGRLAFVSEPGGGTGNVYIEHATNLRSSGFLKTGRIRYNTLESKFFKYVKPRADFEGGSIAVSTSFSTITTVDAATGNTDLGIPQDEAMNYLDFIFTLNRSSTNSAMGPVFYGYQVKALPAVKRQRLVQYNLFCFDHEQDKFNNRIGWGGRAYERISTFEEMEASSNIVLVQDFRTGESFNGLIEECSFMSVTPPHKGFSGFGGILTVTVRKI